MALIKPTFRWILSPPSSGRKNQQATKFSSNYQLIAITLFLARRFLPHWWRRSYVPPKRPFVTGAIRRNVSHIHT
jgi:hypothetical protein